MHAVFVRLEIGFLQVYRAWSATRPPRCRYVPSCSMYAMEALRLHGFLRANSLIFHRLFRCHPWGGWGADPVPPVVHQHVLSQGSPTQ